MPRLPLRPLTRYQAWVDNLNSVIETAPLAARLDVPLLRRADTEPAIPSHHSVATPQQNLSAARTPAGVPSASRQNAGQSSGEGRRLAGGSAAVGMEGIRAGGKTGHQNQVRPVGTPVRVCRFRDDWKGAGFLRHWSALDNESVLHHSLCLTSVGCKNPAKVRFPRRGKRTKGNMYCSGIPVWRQTISEPHDHQGIV